MTNNIDNIENNPNVILNNAILNFIRFISILLFRFVGREKRLKTKKEQKKNKNK